VPGSRISETTNSPLAGTEHAPDAGDPERQNNALFRVHSWQAWHALMRILHGGDCALFAQPCTPAFVQCMHASKLVRVGSPVCNALSRFGGDLNRDLHRLARLLRYSRKRHVPFPKSDTTTTPRKTTFRSKHTRPFEPDPRSTHRKKATQQPLLFSSNFLADCQTLRSTSSCVWIIFLSPSSLAH
jgi:hypothetical protein